MGVIARMLGLEASGRDLGQAVQGVAEVFTTSRTKAMQARSRAYEAALGELAAEFALEREGWFNRFVDALNRLPRPMLALGTMGLFVFAMAAPAEFATRMQALAHVPEPLWWLLGAVVSFYFGARELHYRRMARGVIVPPPPARPDPAAEADEETDSPDAGDVRTYGNQALEEWKRSRLAGK